MFRIILLLTLFIETNWCLKVHGNWCGPYHPGNDVMAEDQVPHPINFTDISCRLHDFNYVNYDDETRPDRVNAWYKIYPFEKQLEVDRLLIRDIEWGLNNSKSWGCEKTIRTEQRHDFSFNCKTPRLTLSDCKRDKPSLHEKLMARVVQLGMFIKVSAGFYLGSDKPGFKVCNSVKEESSVPPQANLLSFARPMVFMEETPSFCEVQADFSKQSEVLDTEEVAEHLKVAFRYFDGRSNKVMALKKMNELIRMCIDPQERGSGFNKASKSYIPQSITNKALQLALEEDYRLKGRRQR